MRRRTIATAAGLLLLLGAATLSGRFVPEQYERAHGFVWIVAVVAFSVWRLWAGIRQDSQILLRIDHGLCRACGYDLRASDDRCPECGRAFQPHEKLPISKYGR